ncbi:hypothetical protein BS50DRAFT_149634 [Corynespora cassiicola Philippines]|uniref:Uncharacterized protein n=1 Tax=Corynespora cassiicola Philippines TaxID=1448308 RepID=A0A2T2N7E9_CORCC|nr:hypothetical protein BS50DRAFT_149634 [Corynespora cassiicola Philippines]
MSNPMQSKPAYCIFLVPAQEEPRSQGPKRAFEKKNAANDSPVPRSAACFRCRGTGVVLWGPCMLRPWMPRSPIRQMPWSPSNWPATGRGAVMCSREGVRRVCFSRPFH